MPPSSPEAHVRNVPQTQTQTNLLRQFDRQGDAARGTRLLTRGFTLLVAGVRFHVATSGYSRDDGNSYG